MLRDIVSERKFTADCISLQCIYKTLLGMPLIRCSFWGEGVSPSSGPQSFSVKKIIWDSLCVH